MRASRGCDDDVRGKVASGVPARRAALEVEIHGSGEPVVLIQTALTAAELVPLAGQPELEDNYRVILYHRRGYAGSSPVQGPGSMERDALDCRNLLAALNIDHAHVVGVSYSAAVALQLAATAPVCTACASSSRHPVHIPSAGEFLAASVQLTRDYRLHGSATALDRLLARVIGPFWRRDIERHVPGGVAQVEQDADTFSATNIPALLTWRFGPTMHGGLPSPCCISGEPRAGRGSQRSGSSSWHGYRRLKM